MDAHTFISQYGDKEAGKVAMDAGTDLVYFKQIATRFRIPSPYMAWRLIRASGYRLSLNGLLPEEVVMRYYGSKPRDTLNA